MRERGVGIPRASARPAAPGFAQTIATPRRRGSSRRPVRREVALQRVLPRRHRVTGARQLGVAERGKLRARRAQLDVVHRHGFQRGLGLIEQPGDLASHVEPGADDRCSRSDTARRASRSAADAPSRSTTSSTKLGETTRSVKTGACRAGPHGADDAIDAAAGVGAAEQALDAQHVVPRVVGGHPLAEQFRLRVHALRLRRDRPRCRARRPCRKTRSRCCSARGRRRARSVARASVRTRKRVDVERRLLLVFGAVDVGVGARS